ncbi:hypothetical protein JHK82_020411 [Glycine max]|uniref:Uncharacterized protein n=1 Tax=Glycine soja TaxID=3848 RepID=A0A445J9W1_GLYSO|nr:uncharacterized protein LOC114421185 [Glycine soja]KAG5014727.1 hypothetical protein JHK85_020863 [Glycine max]KAG5135680.1 hypothetical protein JHK82_020411 [Glycine max]KHN16582.1 hypothetical protein glysoja_002679 [Glycine soja]RZB95181.1 hypothetical protein D0Y65_019563 [Glycine soja]
MEESKFGQTDQRKRVRDESDSVLNSPDSLKHPRAESNLSESLRVDSDEFELARLDPVLLNMLNDAENVAEREPTVLDSVIKSFEEEILSPVPNPNLASEADVFKPNLGYLLEASDDELGLPPTVAPSEDVLKPETVDSDRVGPEGMDLTGFLGFEDDIRSYEGFGFVGYDVGDNGGGYVTIDGLFDYAEPGADILWRSESLQAL